MNSFEIGLGLAGTSIPAGRRTAAQKARAQALLALIDGATAIADAGGDDVVTWSRTADGFAASTLNGNAYASPSVVPRDALVTPIGAVFQDKPGQGAPWTQTIGREDTTGLVGRAAVGPGYRFRINASAIEIPMVGLGPMRMKVNGAWSSIYTGAADSGFPQVKAAWPTKAVRDIEFYPFDDVVLGFNVAAGDTIAAAPALSSLHVGIFGDSYIETLYSGGGAGGNWSGFGIALREACGFVDMLLLGQGGQGAVHGGDTAGKTFLDRVDAGDLDQRGTGHFDLLIFYNSINDFQQTPATLKANWESIVAKARADHPDAFIWGFSGFEWVSSYAADAAHNGAFVEAFTEMALVDPLTGVKDGDGLIITGAADETAYGRTTDPHFNAAGTVHAAAIVKPWLRDFLAGMAG